MCMGSSRIAKKAAEQQAQALNKLAAAQKAKTTDMVAKTAGIVKTNADTQSRTMSSLRIPIQNNLPSSNNLGYGFGLNIPL